MSDERRHAPIILVIEDEADQAAVLATTLTDAGYVVVTAHAGTEGLTLVADVQPDLVILDLRLPDVSGVRVLDVLKHDPATAQVPVLVLTALRFAEAEKVARYGAEAFLTKPYVVDDLLAQVQEVLAPTGVTGVTTTP